MTSLVLKKGREKSLKRRHPWLFSGAIEKVAGKPAPGDTVEIKDASGKVFARAAYSPKSQIRARVWTFDPQEEVDAAFFRARIERALALREALPARRHTNALRLVHGESDGLPGLIVDRYADVLVAQFLAAGNASRSASAFCSLFRKNSASTSSFGSNVQTRARICDFGL